MQDDKGVRVAVSGRSIDRNLLVALRALLEQRNVTRAGEVVNTSQPAMSAALARLRVHFDDELLMRTGRSYELTPLAQELLPEVQHALAAVATALDPWATFDPSTTQRRFTVGGSDYALAVVVEPLLNAIHRQSPAATVDFDPLPAPGSDLLGHLMRRDLVIADVGDEFPGRRQEVFTDRFVCVVSADNPRLVAGRLELTDLAGLSHASSRSESELTTSIDDALLAAGVARQVSVVVPNLLALPFAVAGSDLCAFVPERLARSCPAGLQLVVAEVPVTGPQLVEAAHWHPAREGDPSVRWLRGLLREVSETLGR